MLLVRTALTVIVKEYREMLMKYFCTSIPYLDRNSFWISWYTHCVDGNHKRLSWNAHEILLNITIRFLFNFINYFCIETLSHISIRIHFGFHGTHCVDGNHKRLSWNAHEILLNIFQEQARLFKYVNINVLPE